MRRKFEQFCSRVALDVRRNSHGFKSTLTEGAWLGWREAFAVFQSDVDSLRARVAELEAERAELVKDRERLRDLVRDAWVECYVHTALDDVKTDPMCLAGLEMEAIEDWGESTAKSRLDAARGGE